jgi:magnesium chelatase accessory protein
MCANQSIAPRRLVSLNGALLPFDGAAGVLFSPLARLAAGIGLVPRVIAWRARDQAAVRRLIASTGSVLEPEGVELYRRLLAAPGHVAAVMQMMAQWDLVPLQQALPRLRMPVTLVAAELDRAVRAADAERACTLLAAGSVVRLPGLGHLAHEEDPGAVLAGIGLARAPKSG